ncbi:hypothetical protein DFS28_103243 [Pseudomonas sp. 478]|uniref:hypothetical protein n=1 Tax=unclassified Pseudomonas TaxID=196821 RepID=UPI000DAED11D|nr:MULTISPECIES: hypothetical protein [unclassified Pseudomonas]PZW99181.1 hypothetical protein DFS28_103243 [Pseudomonas sp. 478]TCV45360.1 hypothetical protein EDB99_11975 [Pseudomonas sp. 460]
MLKVIEKEKTTSLLERMDDAGCVFNFVVLSLEEGVKVNESIHRQALVRLHEKLMKDSWDLHNSLIKNPEYKSSGDPAISWELDKAVATILTQEEIHNLILTDGYVRGPLALYGYFREPPYGTEFKGGELEAKELFHEWRQILGLEEQDDIVVINWVKGFKKEWLDNDDAIPGREPWSDYFDEGLEWWGVWCLTIWNPTRRTFSALIASTSD